MLIKRDPDTIRSYFEDASNLSGGHAEEVIFPENVEELSEILREANSAKRPVTVSGGGTGTTGSRIPFGGISLSMERLNKIYYVDAEKMAALVGAGVLVEDLKNKCEEKGLFYTSHPTEKTASAGGTVATNASGSRSFKYGPTRRYVKRLKMVFPSGDMLDLRRGERFLNKRDPVVYLGSGSRIRIPWPNYKIPDVKNSAGYYIKDRMDLIDLFIGQEGTLSVIAEIEFGLVRKPAGILSFFVFFNRREDAWAFSAEARRSSALSIEYFDNNSLGLLARKGRPVPDGALAAIFFEQESDDASKDPLIDKWMKAITRHKASFDDSWAAMDEKEARVFTELRHLIPESINEIVRRSGYQKLSTDIAVPERNFPEMLKFYMDTLGSGGIQHVVFGHIGEFHLHVNLLPSSGAELDRAREMCLAFVKKGVSLGGTISAEHGVGKTKHKYLEIMYGRPGVLDMARVKKAFDPNCILGLDNIFPRSILNEV